MELLQKKALLFVVCPAIIMLFFCLNFQSLCLCAFPSRFIEYIGDIFGRQPIVLYSSFLQDLIVFFIKNILNKLQSNEQHCYTKIYCEQLVGQVSGILN